MEVVVASSSIDGGIGCWELHTGAEKFRYKTCASPNHGLISVGNIFLASSQLRDSSTSSGSILYWSWSKPQVEVKSFPAESIKPLAANHQGTYIVGGGLSGNIYMWEVETGRLLKQWHAHYRAVTCLVFSEDDSLLISGSEDGSVRVWSLLMIFDDYRRQGACHLYEHSFSDHTLSVTDIVIGYGGANAIIVSASEDRTCKVWSLSRGMQLRNIVFPSIIDAVTLDPAEHVFYAGSRDGKIYVAALSVESSNNSNLGLHIINSFSNHSKAVTCLAYGSSGNLLLSGSEDGMVRVWDAKTLNIVRVLKHAKGPVNNILVVRQQLSSRISSIFQAPSRKLGSLLPPGPPPLAKYLNSMDEGSEIKANIGIKDGVKSMDDLYLSSRVICNQIKSFQDSAATTEMEMARLKLECKNSNRMVQQWKTMYENLHQFCVNELLDNHQLEGSNGNSC